MGRAWRVKAGAQNTTCPPHQCRFCWDERLCTASRRRRKSKAKGRRRLCNNKKPTHLTSMRGPGASSLISVTPFTSCMPVNETAVQASDCVKDLVTAPCHTAARPLNLCGGESGRDIIHRRRQSNALTRAYIERERLRVSHAVDHLPHVELGYGLLNSQPLQPAVSPARPSTGTAHAHALSDYGGVPRVTPARVAVGQCGSRVDAPAIATAPLTA